MHEVAVESAHLLHQDARRSIYGVSTNVDKIDGNYTSLADVEVIDISGASLGRPAILGEHYHDSAKVLYVIDGEIDSCILEDITTQEQIVLRKMPSIPNCIFLPASRIAWYSPNLHALFM